MTLPPLWVAMIVWRRPGQEMPPMIQALAVMMTGKQQGALLLLRKNTVTGGGPLGQVDDDVNGEAEAERTQVEEDTGMLTWY
jgi:hypothetical protein